MSSCQLPIISSRTIPIFRSHMLANIHFARLKVMMGPFQQICHPQEDADGHINCIAASQKTLFIGQLITLNGPTSRQTDCRRRSSIVACYSATSVKAPLPHYFLVNGHATVWSSWPRSPDELRRVNCFRGGKIYPKTKRKDRTTSDNKLKEINEGFIVYAAPQYWQESRLAVGSPKRLFRLLSTQNARRMGFTEFMRHKNEYSIAIVCTQIIIGMGFFVVVVCGEKLITGWHKIHIELRRTSSQAGASEHWRSDSYLPCYMNVRWILIGEQ